MGFLGKKYVGLGYYIEVDTEEYILMYRREAHDVGHNPVSACYLIDRTVYYRHY